jgi:predicted amidohydrolase
MRGAGQSDLFVLPELFNTGYDFESAEEAARLAEQEDGATSARISAFAKEHACWVAFGFAEKADRLYNSALLVGPGGIVGKYRKIHLYNRENLFFAPGNLGFPVFDLPFGRIGMMVCFDWIYPESARTLALKGATLIAHPSNLVLPHCPDAMVTRCLENRVFAATANRIGQEERGGFAFTYIGKSQVVSPRGNILARLSAEKPGCATVEIDLREAADKKLNEFNDLFGGRRTDQYQTTAPRE